MRKLIIISVSFILFALGSCTQEALVAPNHNTLQETPNNALTMLEKNDIPLSNSSQDTTVIVQTDEVTISTTNNELIIEFTANFDFSNIIPENTQHLDFEDAQNNISTLTLDINTYLGENGRFEVNFDLGSHSLTDLELTVTQVVVIEEIVSF